jgi:hypothetical protein
MSDQGGPRRGVGIREECARSCWPGGTGSQRRTARVSLPHARSGRVTDLQWVVKIADLIIKLLRAIKAIPLLCHLGEIVNAIKVAMPVRQPMPR